MVAETWMPKVIARLAVKSPDGGIGVQRYFERLASDIEGVGKWRREYKGGDISAEPLLRRFQTEAGATYSQHGHYEGFFRTPIEADGAMGKSDFMNYQKMAEHLQKDFLDKGKPVPKVIAEQLRTMGDALPDVLKPFAAPKPSALGMAAKYAVNNGATRYLFKPSIDGFRSLKKIGHAWKGDRATLEAMIKQENEAAAAKLGEEARKAAIKAGYGPEQVAEQVEKAVKGKILKPEELEMAVNKEFLGSTKVKHVSEAGAEFFWNQPGYLGSAGTLRGSTGSTLSNFGKAILGYTALTTFVPPFTYMPDIKPAIFGTVAYTWNAGRAVVGWALTPVSDTAPVRVASSVADGIEGIGSGFVATVNYAESLVKGGSETFADNSNTYRGRLDLNRLSDSETRAFNANYDNLTRRNRGRDVGIELREFAFSERIPRSQIPGSTEYIGNPASIKPEDKRKLSVFFITAHDMAGKTERLNVYRQNGANVAAVADQQGNRNLVFNLSIPLGNDFEVRDGKVYSKTGNTETPLAVQDDKNNRVEIRATDAQLKESVFTAPDTGGARYDLILPNPKNSSFKKISNETIVTSNPDLRAALQDIQPGAKKPVTRLPRPSSP